MRTTILFLCLFILLPSVSAFVVTENQTLYNSQTAVRNYNDLLSGGSNAYGGGTVLFNHTQTFSGGSCTGTCLWVPWFDSSSACVLDGEAGGGGNLKDDGSGTPCNTNANLDSDTSLMVTDEFSEVVFVLAAGNQSAEAYINASMNTVDMMGTLMTTYGDIPLWKVCRDGTSVTDNSGQDGASDATHRLVIAYYTAANNSAFSATVRARASALASKLMNQSIQYDTTGGTTTYNATCRTCTGTPLYQNVSWWLFLGEDSAQFDGTPSEDMYIGYYQDAIAACLMHAKAHPSNTTLRAVCGNWTTQALAMANYRGGTSAANLTAGYYRFWFNVTSGTVRPGESSPGYYYFGTNNPSWDTADAPRYAGLCRNWLQANWTGYYTMTAAPWANLSTFCAAWNASINSYYTSSNVQACQQYQPNGTCFAGPYNSVRLVGMMGPSYTQMRFYNSTQALWGLNELNSHYSWSTKKIDSTACGGVFSYDNVRFPKSYYYYIGYDQPLVGGPDPRSPSGGGGGGTPAPVISNVQNSSITNQSAVITWDTDLSSNSTVYYGLTVSYGSVAGQNDNVASHSVSLASLTASTTYQYKVGSCNGANCTNGTNLNFTTTATNCGTYSAVNITCTSTGCYLAAAGPACPSTGNHTTTRLCLVSGICV